MGIASNFPRDSVTHAEFAAAELVANKVTVISKTSTDDQYPSAKAVKDFVYGISGLPDMDDLDNMSWADIKMISDANQGANYFDIGDMKAITLNGTVGTLALNNREVYVYILGFNHNSTREGHGITFGTFKEYHTYEGDTEPELIDMALTDANYNTSSSDGSKWLNINHWGTADASPYNTNYGGWAGCDARYDILGSTNRAPSGYGSTPTTDRVGYDPESYDIVNSPVANTLMAALPADLRAVMKLMTKYTDNVGNSSNVDEHISATKDYLPLLAEFEIFGSRTRANTYEQNYQAQYAYYLAGNSKVKYSPDYNDGSAVNWWERSPYYSSASLFCGVSTGGLAYSNGSRSSRGLAPAFLV